MTPVVLVCSLLALLALMIEKLFNFPLFSSWILNRTESDQHCPVAQGGGVLSQLIHSIAQC